MGIRGRPITPHSPWQNGHVERLIGSIRRECLDHVVVLGERHLRPLLANYATYYNGVRTYLALDKDICPYRLCHPNVMPMETAEPRDCYDEPDCLRRSMEPSILVECKVRAHPVVVGLPPVPRHGRDTRAGSSQSAVRHARSATVSVA
jgi:hypothetical protein